MAAIPVQPLILKLQYEGMHLSQNVPPMPCLHLHVPSVTEQLMASSVPVGLQPQAVQYSNRPLCNTSKTYSRLVQRTPLRV